MGQIITAKLTSNNRVTIPQRIRDYYELPDPAEGDVWVELEIHGTNPRKHPDHEYSADHLLEEKP